MESVKVVGDSWPAFRPDFQVRQFLYRFVRIYVKRLFASKAEAQQYIAAVQSAFTSWVVKHFGEQAVTGLHMQPAGTLAQNVVWNVPRETAADAATAHVAGAVAGSSSKRRAAEPTLLDALQLSTPEKEDGGAPVHAVGPATGKRQKGLFMAPPSAAAAAAAAGGSRGEVVADSCSPMEQEGSPVQLTGALSAAPAGASAWAAAQAKALAAGAAAAAAVAAAAADEDVIEDDDEDDMLLSQQASTVSMTMSQFR
jgi:hypothetical protein